MSRRFYATVSLASSIKSTKFKYRCSCLREFSPVYQIFQTSKRSNPRIIGINIPVIESLCTATTFTFNKNSRAMASASISPEAKARLDKVRDAVIDETGRFKYILIKVYAKGKNGEDSDSNSKFIVRGRADCLYHGDIYDKYLEEIRNLEGLDDEILGGGRIERTGNKISVFGYSQGYGRADHTITVEILKRYFPTHDITWSNDGY